MSSTYVHLKLVCKDANVAKQLTTNLSAFDPKTESVTSPLAAVFAEPAELQAISVDGVRVKAEVVSFDYQDHNQADSLSNAQCQAWTDLGVAFVHFNVVDSQGDGEATEYYHGLRVISAKEFKAREVSTDIPDPKKVVTLANQGGDSKVANAIQNGVNVNALVDGMPLYVHIISAKYPLPLAMAALAKQKIDWSLSVQWAHLFTSGFVEFPPSKIEKLLLAMLQAAGPNLAALVRHEAVWTFLLAVPAALEWVCQQPNIDWNAPVLHANPHGGRFGRLDTGSAITEHYCSCGSLLYYVSEAGITRNLASQIRDYMIATEHQSQDVLAEGATILQRYGAKAVAPEGYSLEQQFVHYLQDVADAPSLEQLQAAGLDLQKPLRNGEILLELAREYPQGWPAKMQKINELLIAGADASHWSSQTQFQQSLLVYLFDKSYRLEVSPTVAEKFVAHENATTVVSILTQMARRGVALKKPLKICFQGKDYLNYQGSLLGAVTLLLCSRHSDLRAWCVPLVQLLLAHGGSGQDVVECVSASSAFNHTTALTLTGKWGSVVDTFSFSAKATILERLQQRQALRGFDEIDDAVIQLLQAK